MSLNISRNDFENCYINVFKRSENILIDFLDGGALASGGGTSGRGHVPSTGHSTGTRHATSSAVKLGDDRGADLLHFLLAVVEFLLLGKLVSIEPLDGIVAGLLDLLLVFIADLVLHLLIFIHHPFNVLLAKTSLVIGDGNLVLFSRGLVHGGNIEDTVGVNVEGDFNLGDTAGCRGNSGKLKFPKEIVVLSHGPLTLVNLNKHTRLIVSVGGEDLGVLGRDGRVTLDEGSHHTSSSLNTHGQGSNIKEKEILNFIGGIASEDSSLNSSTIGNSFIGIDRFVQFLAIEEILEELLDLGDPGGATNQNDLLDLALVQFSITQGLLNGVQGTSEEVGAHFFKPSPGD